MSALATGVTMPTAMSLASRAEASVPRRGGHLRLALPHGAETEALIAGAIGNTLTERGPDGAITGDLAARFESDGSGLRWVFDLCPDIVFQDGVPLSAHHVRDALNAATLPGHVTRIDAPDAHRLVVTLDRADPDLPALLSAPRFAVFRHASDGARIGTGGYRVAEAGPATVTLVRIGDYWKPGRAHVDAATLHLTDDPARRQAAVMSGKVDYAAPIPAEAVALLNHLPEVEIATFRATAALVVEARGGDAEAERALRWLSAAISRADLIDRALLGHGAVGDDTARRPQRRAEDTATVAPTPDLAGTRPVALDPGNAEGFARTLSGMAAPLGLGLAIGANRTAALRARIVPAEDIAETVDWTSGVYLPAWTNGLAAHAAGLRHGPLADGAPNDAHRLIERWWFA